MLYVCFFMHPFAVQRESFCGSCAQRRKDTCMDIRVLFFFLFLPSLSRLHRSIGTTTNKNCQLMIRLAPESVLCISGCTMLCVFAQRPFRTETLSFSYRRHNRHGYKSHLFVGVLKQDGRISFMDTHCVCVCLSVSKFINISLRISVRHCLSAQTTDR